MSKMIVPLANVCGIAKLGSPNGDHVVLLDRIHIRDGYDLVLVYWVTRGEYVVWAEYDEAGNFHHGSYFSSMPSHEARGVSGLKAAINCLYRRAKDAGWKPNKDRRFVGR